MGMAAIIREGNRIIFLLAGRSLLIVFVQSALHGVTMFLLFLILFVAGDFRHGLDSF